MNEWILCKMKMKKSKLVRILLQIFDKRAEILEINKNDLLSDIKNNWLKVLSLIYLIRFTKLFRSVRIIFI